MMQRENRKVPHIAEKGGIELRVSDLGLFLKFARQRIVCNGHMMDLEING